MNLIVFKITYDKAFRIVEDYGINASTVAHDWDDNHLLHTRVYHGVIADNSFGIVNANVYTSVISIKIKVNGIFRSPGFNIIGACVEV